LGAAGVRGAVNPAVDPPVAELEELAAGGEYVAVGEIRLDFWRGRVDESRQRAFLAAQARLA
jgi:Tat protein secretion system quality control protein TatD with DNase activity